MAVALRAVGVQANVTVAATSIAVGYPAGLVAGDVLVMHIATNGGNVTTPAGWTQVYSNAGAVVTNPRGGLWLLVATGSETGSLSVTTASVTSSGIMVAFSGVDNVTPQDTTATTVEDNSALVSAVVVPTMTTTMDGTMLVYGCAPNSSTVTCLGPGGSAEDADYGQAGGAGKGGALYHETGPAGGGATGTRTMTLSATRAFWGAMLALRPSAATAGLVIAALPHRMPIGV